MLHAIHYFWWKRLMFRDSSHTVCAHDRQERKWLLLHTVFMVRSVPGGVPSVRGQGNEAQPADALKENYAAALWCAVLECLFKWRAFECCSPALIVWHKADTMNTDALTCVFTDSQQWPSAITNRLTKEHSFIHGPGGSLIWDVNLKWNTKPDQVWTAEDQGTCCLNWHYNKENISAPLIISVLRAIYTKACLRNTSIGPNLKLTK